MTATTSTPRSLPAIPLRPVVPPRANAVPSETARTGPTQRDRHLRCIAECGRMGWERASGYNWRALVEADIAPWKCVIGGGRRSQTQGRQATEVAIPTNVLNRMSLRAPGVRPHRITRNTGRAQCVYTADPCNTVGGTAPMMAAMITRTQSGHLTAT